MSRGGSLPEVGHYCLLGQGKKLDESMWQYLGFKDKRRTLEGGIILIFSSNPEYSRILKEFRVQFSFTK